MTLQSQQHSTTALAANVSMMSPLRHSYQQKQQSKITTTSISPRIETTTNSCSSPLLLTTALSSPTSSIHSSPINNLRLISPRFQQQQEQQSNLNSVALKQLDLFNVKNELKEPTTTNDSENRSTSVKAESCYENLSSESDFEEEDSLLSKKSPITNINLGRLYTRSKNPDT